MKQSINILLSGGGTGGHIYPAVAIADELKKRYSDANILFVGAKDRMEMEKVPQNGYPIKGLWISGLNRQKIWTNVLFPFKLISSLFKAYGIIKKFKPQVVIGTGGFASGPTLYVASALGKPCLIQEQNSYPGITNKLLSKKVEKICVAYDNLERFFPKEKIVKTGNPVRQDLQIHQQDKKVALKHFGLEEHKQTILVLGGSLGARAINRLIAENLDYLLSKNVQLIWQTGKLYYEEYKHLGNQKQVKTMAFINKMNLAYSAADIIISRAGAGTISELCIVGKPVLFVPSPNVAEDHQTKNAEAVVAMNAAVLLKESELDKFKKEMDNLIENSHLKDQLGANIAKLALPKATEHIVNEIEKIIQS